jgi:hypothetical protein
VEREVAADKAVHVVLDNYATHKAAYFAAKKAARARK